MWVNRVTTERSWRNRLNVLKSALDTHHYAGSCMLGEGLDGDYRFGLNEALRLLTWSLWGLFGWCILAFGLDSGGVEDTRGGTVLTEVLLEAFDGAIELAGPDLEVDVHEVCVEDGKEEEREITGKKQRLSLCRITFQCLLRFHSVQFSGGQ